MYVIYTAEWYTISYNVLDQEYEITPSIQIQSSGTDLCLMLGIWSSSDDVLYFMSLLNGNISHRNYMLIMKWYVSNV